MAGNARTIIDKIVSKYTLAYARAIAWGEDRWSGFVRSQKRLIVTENSPPKLRMVQLMRDEDPSGVSGVGRVAVGVVFPSGKVVLEWLDRKIPWGSMMISDVSNTFMVTEARLGSFSREVKYHIGRCSSGPKLRERLITP